MSIAESKGVVSLLDEILDECEDDHVGLWSILREVRQSFGNASPAQIRDATLGLLRFLLHRHLIEAGTPTTDGNGFVVWQLSPDEAIAKIAREWDQLGRDPSGGEIVWFTTPQ